MRHTLSHYRACLLGGALGDALGFPVEFMTLSEIRRTYGPNGILDLDPDPKSGKALISDDTQMTLFTAAGLLRAHRRMSERGIGSYAVSGTYQAYREWYRTQNEILFGHTPALDPDVPNLLAYPDLCERRAPGNSCLTALGSGVMGTIQEPINNSKGCGGVMRAAPVGLLLWRDPVYAMHTGCEIAAITHGHPSGYLSAGMMAAMIAQIIMGRKPDDAARDALALIRIWPGHEECYTAVQKALALAVSDTQPLAAIETLGEGWVGEEALAIAVYCAVKFRDEPLQALCHAVNHSGDSDSTGGLCGSLLGAYHGIDAFPASWVERVELRGLIEELADKLFVVVT